MWIAKILIGLVVAYLAILAAVYFAQDRLLFPGSGGGSSRPLPPRAERLIFEGPDGTRLHGVVLPPRGGDPGDRALILGFGGNAWDADEVALTLAELFPSHRVAAFHYRGYGPSGGRAGGKALLADAPLIHDELVRRLRPARVIAVGFSIGSGVAARLARERRLAGVILVTPFDSLAAVAADHYPWLPIRFLFRHEMPAARDLAGSRVPVAIVAAERDRLILPPRTEALRRALPTLVSDRTLPGAGHNEIYGRADFPAAMQEALARLEKLCEFPSCSAGTNAVQQLLR
ncbi:alpha/beta hydrolase [Allosphingosinicella sp.]|jgi:hypothetical protein|uniref:alpha/beta hydrolase n=1 Tax=Allosphingosinicella sp. TaxID=2823234 RepID=UPI002EFFF998